MPDLRLSDDRLRSMEDDTDSTDPRNILERYRALLRTCTDAKMISALTGLIAEIEANLEEDDE